MAVLVLAFNLRSVISVVPPLLGELRAEIGLSTFTASVLGMLPPAVFGISGLVGGAVVTRLGAQRAAWVAMAGAALAQVARAFTGESVGFVLTTALAIAGLGIGNVVAPVLVKLYFPGRLGLATGLYVISLQMGTGAPSQLAVPVTEALSWRWSLGIWAVPALLAASAWIMLSGKASRRVQDLVPRTRARVPVASLFRSRLAWSLALMFGMQSLLAYTVIAWLPTIYTEAGLSPATGGTALAVYALFQIPMSLGAPVIASRVSNVFWLVLVFVGCYTAAFLGLGLGPTAAPMLWASLLGLASGPFPLALALVTLRARTGAGATALSAFGQGMGYLFAVTGPLLAGLLRELTGGWDATLVMMGILLVPLTLGAAGLARPVMVEDQLASPR